MKCSNCLKETPEGKFCCFCGFTHPTQAVEPEILTESITPPVSSEANLSEPAQRLLFSNNIVPESVNNVATVPQVNNEADIIQNSIVKDKESTISIATDEPVVNKKSKILKKIIATLYIVIAVFSVVLGSYAGYLTANGKLNLFGLNAKDKGFHWSNPQNAVNTVTHPVETPIASDGGYPGSITE